MSALAEIRALLQDYLDALYRSDADLLGQVMHARAIYASGDEQPLLYRTMDEYLPIVAGRLSPQSRGEQRQDFIDSIDIAGENTARAQVRCAIATRQFVDYLTMVRDDGRWQIISKIFQIIE